MLHATLLADRGLIDLRAGRLTSARARLWAALDSDWIPDEGEDSELEGLILARYALCEALDGRLDSSRAWYASAASTLSSEARPNLLTTAFVIEARGGDVARALEKAEEGWEHAQATLPKDELRLLGILISFGREQGGAGFAEAGPWFDLMAPGEADFLGDNWSQMGAFLLRHQRPLSAEWGIEDDQERYGEAEEEVSPAAG